MSYEKKLVRLSDEIYTLKSLIDDLQEKIEEYFEKNEVLTIAQVRDMCNTSRKCAKILIEYFDEQKFTKKVGAETERVHY
jgi:selenocysteine-specific translation elongation factor